MTIYEATGYFVNKLLEKGESINLEICDKTEKGTHVEPGEEKENIFITISKINVEVCLHSKGINAKTDKTSPFARHFDFDTKNTGVVKKFFYYNEETPETETLDNVVDFIKSLT